MATTIAAANVTAEYRQRVAALVRQVDERTLELWHGNVSWDDLRGTYAPVAGRVQGLVEEAQRQALRMAVGYFSGYLATELGERTELPAFDSTTYVGLSFGGTPIKESLDNPLAAMLSAIRDDMPDPLGIGLRRLRNQIDLDMKAPARQLLQDLMQADERVIGWRRVTGGTCGACLGTSGENLPPGTPLNVHPHCQCVSEPIPQGREPDIRPSAQQRFERMSPKEQDEAFGTETALALRQGMIRLDDLIEARTGPIRTSGVVRQHLALERRGIRAREPAGVLRQKALRDVLDRDQLAEIRKAAVRRRAAKKAAVRKKENVAVRQQREAEARARAEAEARARAEAERKAREAREEIENREIAFEERARLEASRIRRLPRSEQLRAKRKEAGRKAAERKRLNERKRQLEAQQRPAEPRAAGEDVGRLAESPVDDVSPLGGGISSSLKGKLDDGTRVVLKQRERYPGLRDGIDETMGPFKAQASSRIADFFGLRAPKAIARPAGSMGRRAIEQMRREFERARQRGLMDPVDFPINDASTIGIQKMWPGFKTHAQNPLVASKTEAQKMQLFDYITGQTDRHAKNFGWDSDGNLIAIDMDLSFPTARAYGNMTDWVSQTSGRSLTHTRIPDDLMRKLTELKRDQSVWSERLAEDGLSDGEIAWFWKRVDHVIQSHRFPKVDAMWTAYYR